MGVWRVNTFQQFCGRGGLTNFFLEGGLDGKVMGRGGGFLEGRFSGFRENNCKFYIAGLI